MEGRRDNLHRLRNRFVIAGFVALVMMCVPLVFAYGKSGARGIDDIYDVLGQDVPSEWDSWSQEERFTHLRSMGVYPPEGSQKYSGETGNLTPYFEWLGIPMPDGWMDMSFAERKGIVDQAIARRMDGQDLDRQETPTEKTVAAPIEPATLKLSVLLGGILLGTVFLLMSYKVDRLRAGK